MIFGPVQPEKVRPTGEKCVLQSQPMQAGTFSTHMILLAQTQLRCFKYEYVEMKQTVGSGFTIFLMLIGKF
jgi:hypothetical protein